MRAITKRQMRKVNRKYRRKKIRYWFENTTYAIYALVIFFVIVVVSVVIFVSIIFMR